MKEKMDMGKMAAIGVLLDEETCKKHWHYGLNVFEKYVEEILHNAGITYTLLESVESAVEFKPDLLLVAVAPETRQTAESLVQYAESGGIVISYGGINSMASRLGFMKSKEYSEGYADLTTFQPSLEKLRYLSATPWIKDSNTKAAPVGELKSERGELFKETPHGDHLGAALQQFSVGKGAIDRWAVNIPYTVAAIQHGTKPVLEDGVPAPDGSAQVNEGLLKIDDVLELDWQWDRGTTAGTPFPYFQIPYADLWREVLIQHLVERALSAGLTIPMIGYWPNGVSQVALISFDSDHNINDEAWTTIELLNECQIPSTWCMCVPGYEPSVYERVKADGHELALHYNAVISEGFAWGVDSFRSQMKWLREATGETDFTSNKNHVTREEGWGDLFRWCELEGIASDQTRGSSKKGNGGFAYGTCQPYFPIAWANEENRMYDVLQIGFLLSDFNHMGTDTYVPILNQARRVGGVAHFVLHQTHIHTKEIDREWLRAIVQEARLQEFVFWTGKQINDWQRARREVQITSILEDGSVKVAGNAPEGLVVYVPVSEHLLEQEWDETVIRFGIHCRRLVKFPC
jgi:hypothetical protein